MKKLFMAIALASSVCLITGCSSGGDPKATLSAFFDAMSKKDIAAARKLSTEDSKSMLDLMEKGLTTQQDNAETDKYDKSKMEIGEPKIEGDKATIAVKEKREEKFPFSPAFSSSLSMVFKGINEGVMNLFSSVIV